jgi:hypothetical protein
VFYGVWEAVFGIAVGLLADSGNSLSGAERQGVAEAVDHIAGSALVGEMGLFLNVGSLAWWTGIAAAVIALKQAGVGPTALVLLAVGGLLTFHVPIGPAALVCLSAASYLIERRRPALPTTAPERVYAS